MSQKGCTPPALLRAISSPFLDIRNNITRECTPPAILRLISSSRPLDSSNHRGDVHPLRNWKKYHLLDLWMLGTVSRGKSTPPATLGVILSSPSQDIRNKTTEGMYTHCDGFNNVILYPLAIRNNIIEGCTLSSMLGVISSPPARYQEQVY